MSLSTSRTRSRASYVQLGMAVCMPRVTCIERTCTQQTHAPKTKKIGSNPFDHLPMKSGGKLKTTIPS